MVIIDLWLEFGNHFHQDFLLDYPDFFSGIKFVLSNFSLTEQVELREYLISILKEGAGHSSKDLAVIWKGSGAEFYVPDAQIREFLNQISSVINEEISINQR